MAETICCCYCRWEFFQGGSEHWCNLPEWCYQRMRRPGRYVPPPRPWRSFPPDAPRVD